MSIRAPAKVRPVRSRPIEIVVILVVLALGAWYAIDHSTIVVRVENAGGESMDDVTIVMAGTRWDVGRLERGESRSKRFFLGTDSRVEIRYVAADGSRQGAMTGPYLAPNDHGSLKVRIEDRGVVRVESFVR